MPESLTGDEIAFGQSIYLKRNDEKAVRNLVSEQPELQYIGKGAECTVIGQLGFEHRVTAFKYSEMEPAEMLNIFYTQRILSTLFPHNFPRFYTAFYGDKDKKIPAGTIRQKVDSKLEGRYVRYSTETSKVTKFRFSDVVKTLNQLNIGIGFDPKTKNYDIGPDGGEYYLDTPIMGIFKDWDKKRILGYMHKHKYSKSDIRSISGSIDRLVVINSASET
jgi:hypothetical protein